MAGAGFGWNRRTCVCGGCDVDSKDAEARGEAAVKLDIAVVVVRGESCFLVAEGSARYVLVQGRFDDTAACDGELGLVKGSGCASGHSQFIIVRETLQ